MHGPGRIGAEQLLQIVAVSYTPAHSGHLYAGLAGTILLNRAPDASHLEGAKILF